MPKGRRVAGEGSIRQRKDGIWRARLRFTDPITDLPAVADLYGRTRGEVVDKLWSARRRIQQGHDAKPERVTLAEYLVWWLENVAKPSVRATTYRSYEGIVRNHLAPSKIAAVPIAQLRPAAIQAVLGAPKTPTRAYALAIGVLRQALDRAVELHLLERNPAAGLKPPRVERREMRVLSREQVRAFLAAAREDRYYALYALALFTGLRQGELLGLRWSDVDVAHGRLTVARSLSQQSLTLQPTKTRSSRRIVDLGPAALQALREHRERYGDGERVFTDTSGSPVRASNLIRRSFHPALERAGIKAAGKPSPIRFHDLRHTSATLMLSAGVHPKIVSERLGHASTTITMDVYSHVQPSMQRAAAKALERLISSAGQEHGGKGGGRTTKPRERKNR